MFKVYRFTILIIMLFGIQFAVYAQQQVAVSDPISNVVDEIVKEWKELFAIKRATVVEMKGDEVYINLADKHGVTVGMEFDVIRPGEDITDPETGEILGPSETPIGEIKISRVRERMSIGKILSQEKGRTISIGDVAYSKAVKLKVAVTELSMTDGQRNALGVAVAEKLMTKLVGRIGRFEILERSQIDKTLEELNLNLSDLFDPESVKRVGKILGTDTLVVGTMAEVETTVDLNIRLIQVGTGIVIAMASKKLLTTGEIQEKLGQKLTRQRQVAGKVVEIGKEETSLPSKSVDNLVFTLKECKYSGGPATCSFTVTNKSQTDSVKIKIYGNFASLGDLKSRLYDDLGNEYRAESITFGDKSSRSSVTKELPPRTVINLILKFEGVSPEAKLAKSIVVLVRIGRSRKRIKLLFQDVPLTRPLQIEYSIYPCFSDVRQEKICHFDKNTINYHLDINKKM